MITEHNVAYKPVIVNNYYTSDIFTLSTEFLTRIYMHGFLWRNEYVNSALYLHVVKRYSQSRKLTQFSLVEPTWKFKIEKKRDAVWVEIFALSTHASGFFFRSLNHILLSQTTKYIWNDCPKRVGCQDMQILVMPVMINWERGYFLPVTLSRWAVRLISILLHLLVKFG